MATSVLNNMSAQTTLGELNKNVTQVGKLLGKISSGTRIVGARDDASGWSISERMREQIRSLLQDNHNVQNGSALVRTAEGGIDCIIDELRHLKELAINAANDSNSDSDRETIQKEFDQKIDNINDIATETNYNGIPLLDGRWRRAKPIISNGGISENRVTGMFNNSGLTVATANPLNGKTTAMADWVNGRQVYEGPPYTPFPLDFSSATRNGTPLTSSNMPSAMDGQGFYVVCSGNSDSGLTSFSRYPWCPHSHAFVFDANMAVGTGITSYDPDKDCKRITVGIAGITNPADLSRALFEGARSAMGLGSNTTSVPISNSDVVTLTDNGDGTYSISRNYGMWIVEAYPEEEPSESMSDYNPLVIHHGTKSGQAIHLFINDMHTKSLKTDIPNAGDLERLEKILPSNLVSEFREELHNSGISGAEASIDVMDDFVEDYVQNNPAFQRTSYYKNYQDYRNLIDEAKATMTLDNVSVRNQHDANVAIRVVDGALEYALDETTYMGAYVQRLYYLDSDITTTGENTQSAESVIRDADMAREMVEYTKANVLAQGAQGMLAQANQNASQVLSLLQ